MPLSRVHGKLMSPDSLWARKKQQSESSSPDEQEVQAKEQKSSNMSSADEELDDDFDDIDVDTVLRRADQYATEPEVSGEYADDDDGEDVEEVDEDDDAYEEETDAPETDEQLHTQPVAESDDDSQEDEDEDEIVTEDDEDIVDSAVETDDNDVDEDLPMADKKMSMSDHVRREIDKRKASGDSLRGVDIVNALAKRGVQVSAAQVSVLLKKAGVTGGKAGRPRRAPAATSEEETSRAASKKNKPAETTRTRRPAPIVSATPRPTTPTRVAPKVASSSAAATDPGLLAAAQGYFEACGHDMHAAQKFLRAAEAVHNALSEFE